MESELVNVSNDHEKKNPEIKHEEKGKPLIEGKAQEFSSPPSSLSSSSSTSSSSSLEFDTAEKSPLENVSTKSNLDGNLSSSPESVSSPDISTEHSTVTCTEIGLQSCESQMKSPPIQTMGQPASYDPNRIPSSIFSSKPTTPTEWSVASNESLFSIHMGNNSFSRDHAILFGKSGELPLLEDWSNSPSPNLHYVSETKSNELSSLPPVMEVPAHEESCEKSGKVDKLENEDSTKSSKAVPGTTLENHAKEKVAPAEEVHLSPPATSSSLPRLSDESGNSSSSFAFPVLVNDGGKSRSLKVVTEKHDKPQTQSNVSKATPKEAKTRWFSYFSCWHRCC